MILFVCFLLFIPVLIIILGFFYGVINRSIIHFMYYKNKKKETKQFIGVQGVFNTVQNKTVGNFYNLGMIGSVAQMMYESKCNNLIRKEKLEYEQFIANKVEGGWMG